MKPMHALNLGVYGCIRAGKTLFLYQLLRYWQQKQQVIQLSDKGVKFLETVQSEIERYKGSLPTMSNWGEIPVQVRRGDSQPDWDLTFRDLTGEWLEKGVDKLDSADRDNLIQEQVRQCDAFLFFFNPVHPEYQKDLDEYYQREFQRAEKFLEYVLKERQNQHLPTVFVLTCKDQWEDRSDIRVKLQNWIERVHRKLQELYDHYLRGHYPQEFVEQQGVFLEVCSTGRSPQDNQQLEKVVDRLADLVHRSRRQRQQIRRRGLRALLLSVAVLAGLGGLGWWLVNREPPTPPSLPTPPIEVRLRELEELLKTHPTAARLPSVKEAEEINKHLAWLVPELDPNASGAADVAESTRQHMRELLERTSQLILEKTRKADPTPEALAVLAAYLKKLPDASDISPPLAQAQQRYWELQRTACLQQLAEIIRRRQEVASPPLDTFVELANKLREMEQQVRQDEVFLPQARRNLREQLQTAATFCEDRLKQKGYTVHFRVTSAHCVPEAGEDEPWRGFDFGSPGHPMTLPPNPYRLVPKAKGPGKVPLATKEPSYSLPVGLGTPVECALYRCIWKTFEWERLHKFDLITEPGPYAPLGMPLHPADQEKREISLRYENHEVNLEFFNFQPIPALLREAVALARKEKKS
ncbi:MAG: hypothetical protein N3E46_05385 [Gemmataceae bacterium]|jgi:GTPase SAR1 family protein|nr:hypothetical protein [Gemmataceae bacterium]